ncbi:MAG: hypothetical protein IPM47_19605 [Sphingobacteriales bacterium]|nr:MAG: hypothetical protein IPM47_19605 [Sphingobacteriales bacterium]
MLFYQNTAAIGTNFNKNKYHCSGYQKTIPDNDGTTNTYTPPIYVRLQAVVSHTALLPP